MSGQTPNRNQRSKGIKVKHVLQIFLLLAVCFLLIYQVKHSHDKKKEFDESDVKVSITRGCSDGFIRLGRKDIHPQEEDTITKIEEHDEESEKEETTGVVDENKNEEDELKDKKVEDTENEKGEGGDDDIEDHGQKKLDSEVDREEDFVDGDEEREDDDENENKNEEKDSEDGQMEKESSIEKR